ncbi:hypothetical protein BKA62DRAFT_731506 [Auriculariales sp. MPI-PUGE-AT-0066]|nr:hypothetical protein BKA62DRAFT_731506 [Auriculariales sp. MPI-PUGE-AT-0066]
MGDNDVICLDAVNRAMPQVGGGRSQVADFTTTLLPQARLVDLLQPAPIMVAILGQLTVVASATDFRLVKPSGGFKHVKYPTSFRATVSQLVDAGAVALQKSHANFDTMQKRCASVKPAVNNIISLLAGQHASSEDEMLLDIARFLPNQLQGLDAAVQKCLSDAETTHQAFEELQELVQEITQSCIVTKGEVDRDIRDVEIKKKVLANEKTTLEAYKQLLKEHETESRDALKEAQTLFNNAAEKLPSGFKILAVGLAQDILTGIAYGGHAAFAAIIRYGPDVLKLGLQKNSQAGNSAKPEPNAEPAPKIDRSWQKAMALSRKAVILKAAATGGRDNGVNWNLVSSNDPNGVAYVKGELEVALETPWEDTAVATRVKDAFRTGIKLATKLADAAGPNPDPDIIVPLVKDIEQYHTDVFILAMEAAAIINTQLADPGHAVPTEVEKPTRGSSTTRMALEMAQFKLATTQMQLDIARQTTERQTDKLVAVTKELDSVLGQIVKINAENPDWGAIQIALCNALKFLSQVKDSVATLVLFFTYIRNLVCGSMKDACSDFAGFVTDATKVNAELGGIKLSNWTRQVLYDYALSVAKVSHLVQRIAEIYNQVYCRHIHGGVGKLLLMGSLLGKRDDGAARAAVQDLQAWSASAVHGIRDLIGAEQDKLVAEITGRMHQLESTLGAILPPPDSAMQRAADSAVKAHLKRDAEAESLANAHQETEPRSWQQSPSFL